jgi:hypothetical protein
MDFVEKVRVFNQLAGTEEKLDARKVALYTALQLEELAEKIHAIAKAEKSASIAPDKGLGKLLVALEWHSSRFKAGEFDELVAEAVKDTSLREEILDADVDVAVVSIGGAISIGADVQGACHAVADNNLTKFPIINGVRTVLKDENGKVKKPEGYTSVKLGKFLK